MRWILLALFTALSCGRADNLILNAPSPAQIDAKVPAKPPVYKSELPSTDGNQTHIDESSDATTARSHDGLYLAATGVQPDRVAIWRADKNHQILIIAKMSNVLAGDIQSDSPDLIQSYVRYEIPNAEAEMAWSPDSSYLVMTTVNPGGHSPWHLPALAYSVKTKTLRYMDPVIGDVISSSFRFAGPHNVEMSLAPASRDFAHPDVITVDLERRFDSMPKVHGRIMGEMHQ